MLLDIWVRVASQPVPDEYEMGMKPSEYFDQNMDDEWLRTDFCKRILKEIDQSELLESGYIISDFAGKYLPYRMSSGCKALLLFAFCGDPELCIRSSYMGDNCYELLGEALAIRKSLNLGPVKFIVRHCLEASPDIIIDGFVKNTGKPVYTLKDLFNVMYFELEDSII